MGGGRGGAAKTGDGRGGAAKTPTPLSGHAARREALAAAVVTASVGSGPRGATTTVPCPLDGLVPSMTSSPVRRSYADAAKGDKRAAVQHATPGSGAGSPAKKSLRNAGAVPAHSERSGKSLAGGRAGERSCSVSRRRQERRRREPWTIWRLLRERRRTCAIRRILSKFRKKSRFLLLSALRSVQTLVKMLVFVIFLNVVLYATLPTYQPKHPHWYLPRYQPSSPPDPRHVKL